MNSEEEFIPGGTRPHPYAGPLGLKRDDGRNRTTFRGLDVYTATDTGLWVVFNKLRGASKCNINLRIERSVDLKRDSVLGLT